MKLIAPSIKTIVARLSIGAAVSLLVAFPVFRASASSYPKVQYVRMSFWTSDTSDAGASGMRMDTGGFKDYVVAYRNGHRDDTSFGDGWITMSHPADVGVGEHNKPGQDNYVGRPWQVDTWFKLDPPIPYSTAVSALRSAGLFNTASNDRWNSDRFDAKLVLTENGSVVNSFSTDWVWFSRKWYNQNERLKWGAAADKLEGKYNSPLIITKGGVEKDKISHTMSWNTTGTVKFEAYDPDAATSGSVVDSSNALIIPENAVTVQVSDSNVTVTLKPAANKYGSADIGLKFKAGSSEKTITLSVTVAQEVLPPEKPEDPPKPAVFPTLTLGSEVSDGRVRVATSRSYGLNVTDPESSGAEITLSATSASSSVIQGGAISFTGDGSNRTMVVNASFASPGTSLITVTARNKQGNTASKTFTLDVRADRNYDSLPRWANSTTGLSFNGRDDVVKLPESVWASGDLTIEGWVLLRQHKPWAGLLELGNGPVGNRIALVLSYSDAGGRAALVGNEAGSTLACVASRPLTLQRWTHVAATIEKGRARIYYDGELVADGSVPGPANARRTQNTIGYSSFDAAGFVDGVIDEVRLWSVARTADQLRKYRFPMIPATPLTSDSGLVGYWPMNNGTGNAVSQAAGPHGLRASANAADALYPCWTVGVPNSLDYRLSEDAAPISITLGLSSGSGTWSLRDAPEHGALSQSNGTLAGSVTYTVQPDFNSGAADQLPDGFTVLGLSGSANLAPQRVNVVVQPVNDAPRSDTRICLSLAGGSVEVPGSAAALSRPQNQDFSLEAWISPTAKGGPILCKRGEFYLGLTTNNAVSFYRADRRDRALVTSTRLTLSSWTHIAATFDGTTRRIYIDGTLQAEESGTGEETVLVTIRTQNLRIGWTDISAEPVKTFTGAVDEVRVWGRALEPDQVARLANSSLRGDGSGNELGLIAYYRFDEGQGVIAYDALRPVTDGPAPMDANIIGNTAWSTRSITITNWVDEDTVSELILPASDIDRSPARATGTRDRLEYTIVRSPNHGVLTLRDPVGGIASYLPGRDYTGPDSFIYTVQDASGSVSQPTTVELYVVNVNDPPVIDPIPNLVIPDGDGTTIVSLRLSDVDGPENPSITGLRLDPRNLIPPTNAILVTNVAGGLELQITPPSAVYGTVKMSVTASDGEASTVQSFTVSLIPSLVYHVIDLGDLAQDPITTAASIDDVGRVGGSIGAGTSERGLLFGSLLSGGTLLDTGLNGINHRITGVAAGAGGAPLYEVGSFLSNGKRQAYRRVDGVATNFNWSNGGEALAVNRFGTVVGVATNMGIPYPFYLPSSVNKLVNPPWLITLLPRGTPVGIDEQETLVGYSKTNNQDLGWIYRTYDTNLTYLKPPSGFVASRPSAISEKGVALAGYLTRQSDNRSLAAVFSRSTTNWTILSTNWVSSRAYGINNSLQVVGEAEISPGVTNAFLVSNSKRYNLNDLLGPDSPWTLERATAINNLGQIAGTGLVRLPGGGTERHAFIAIPANVIGLPVPRPLGAVALPPSIDLLQCKPTDTPQQSFIWGDKEKTLYAVRPVTARLSWSTTTDLTSTNARRITVFAANLWPRQPQVHAAGAPVIVEPEKKPWPFSFLQQAYNDVPGAELDQQVKKFNTPTTSTGYTVWHYLRTDGLPAEPNTQTNFFTVVRTYTVPQLLANMHLPPDQRTNQVDTPWPIGTPIVDADHKELSGRNGFVYYEKSAYDGSGPKAAYDRTERRGEIIAVNKLNRRLAPVNGQDWNDKDLVVVWYSLNNLGVAWAERPIRYEPFWPTDAPHIVIASALGTSPHGPISSALAPEAHLYNQPDGSLPGFNPNEEHAMLLGEIAYALRCDLNALSSAASYSEPYVLVKYRDPVTRQWRGWVYRVVAEEDPYTFRYPGVAGTEVQPPLPLSALPLCPDNRIAAGLDIAIKDYKGKIYARAAGPRGTLNSTLDLRYYYPFQPDFFWHDSYGTLKTWVPWLDRLPGGSLGVPVPVRYDIRWPDDAPVLDVGETLLRPKHGLPGVMDMASVRLIYDSSNPKATDPSNADAMRIGTGFLTSAPTNLVRLFDPLSERYVKLPSTFILPESIRVWDAPQGRKVFADLPYDLRLRLSYDPMSKWLYFKGYMDESGIGEPLILLNVMTADEKKRIQDLDGKNNSSTFDRAIESLYWLTRNPNGLDLNKDGAADEALLVGLQYRQVTRTTNIVDSIITTNVAVLTTNVFTKVVSTNMVSKSITNTVEVSYQDSDRNYIDFERLPAGPKALTAALGNNEAAPPSPGYALSLNNNLANHLVVNNMPSAQLDRFTWEAWVHRLGANSEDIIVSWGQSAHRFQAGFRDDGYAYFQVGGLTLVSDRQHFDQNSWHHWAGVYDATGMGMFLYRDGELVGQADLPEAVPWNPEGDLRIGSGVARDSRAGFYGYIDEVRMWTNVARDYTQLAVWRNATLLARTPGLAGYWQMDDRGSQIRDASGNNRPAYASGTVNWSSAAGQGWGVPPRYISIMENNDPALGGLPVTVKVIQIGPGPFAGDLKVIYPDNVFDERLTLRVSSDFGAQPEAFDFEWYYKPDAPNFRRNELPEADPESGAIADAHGWIPYVSGFGNGKNSITIGEGGESGLITLSDNWFVCRYRGYNVGTNRNVWSPWIGDPSSKSEPWPMLAEGWVKRVIRGLNPFDERVSDLSQAGASTKTSMLQQAGQRYEGDIAFNPSPENLNRIGLIEAYETVLRRARSLSTDGTPPVNFQPANNALLLVASRIADLYSMLGNESYADAIDPTVGFTTDNPNISTYGNVASSMFSFMNQVDSLLEEELCLLRGRDNTGAGVQGAPVYNRLLWNFTLGDGEVAYVNSYNLADQNGDGKIDEKDARIMFPQGHGDAWGHYLTATKTYYALLRNPNFTWVPRSENVLVAGVPVKVDYLDERKFALAAAAKAKVGAEIVDLTYRRNYVEDPNGQWQGYADTDPGRAWGVDEWARRGAHAALFDWFTVNAILPAVDPDPSHSGLDRIDRSTVPEMREIATQMEDIVNRLDTVDGGLNPLGLAKGVVPFDIDPSFLDIGSGTQGKTHFDQIAERAVNALVNTLRVFNEVNGMTQSLRANEDSTETFARGVAEQERDFKNRLIEIFGYPYAGEIGPGKLYPSGYDGPDLSHFMYVDTSEINPGMEVATAEMNGFLKFLKDSDTDAGVSLDQDVQNLREDLSSDYSNNYKSVTSVNYPLSSGSYLFEAPESWGKRRAPGELQTILSDLVQADARLKQAVKAYDELLWEIKSPMYSMGSKYNSYADMELEVLNKSAKSKRDLIKSIANMESAQIAMNRVSSAFNEASEVSEKTIPSIAGLAVDVGAPLKGAVVATFAALRIGADLTSDGLGIAMSQKQAQQEVDAINEEIKLKSLEAQYELRQTMNEMSTKLRQEPALRLEMHTQKEVVEQTFGRYRAALANGQRILEERNTFRRKTAGDATKVRYRDMAYRIFRNDAIQKYRASFDLAARYVYLAAAAYDYESNLIGSEGKAGRRFFTDLVRERTLGAIVDGEPVAGQHGLASALARMKANYAVMKTQMGFNNPQTETGRFSLRRELFRIRGEGGDADDLWREQLRKCQVEDLWQVPEFKRFCRPMAPQSMGAQPAIVIRFPTTVTFGMNYFGWPLSGGDSAYDPTQFATKIRSAGIWFSGYDGNGMSMTPRVYLVPVGADVLRSPNGDNFELRFWRVADQKIPLPFPISEADIRNPKFIPVNDTLSGSFAEIRKFSSLRAYHDGGDFDPAEASSDCRLIGRSVWNTEWLLIIPGGTLLNNADAGLESFTTSVSDIKVFFQTYAYSGN